MQEGNHYNTNSFSIPQRKPLCSCSLCRRSSYLLSNSSKIKISQLILLLLEAVSTTKGIDEFISLQKDVVPFVEEHFVLLKDLPLFRNKNWKKALLDALNHSPKVESGKNAGVGRGYYRLKNLKQQENMTDLERLQKWNFDLISKQISSSLELLEKLIRLETQRNYESNDKLFNYQITKNSLQDSLLSISLLRHSFE